MGTLDIRDRLQRATTGRWLLVPIPEDPQYAYLVIGNYQVKMRYEDAEFMESAKGDLAELLSRVRGEE